MVVISPCDLDTGAVVDLLFASSGVEAELAATADVIEVLPGVAVPVAGVADLIVLKLLARAPTRPQDDADLAALLEIADKADLDKAQHLAQLVVERGYVRDRDLPAEVVALTAGGGSR